MNESQVAHRWKLSVKTLRHWRGSGDGPRWHKLFKLVRYHRADVIEFERKGAQFWEAILEQGERIPKVVTRPATQDPEPAKGDAARFLFTGKEVLEATGLPALWFNDPMTRAAKRIPHATLVGSVRYSLDALWAWEQVSSAVGRPRAPERAPLMESVIVPPPRVPRWHELRGSA